MVQPSQLFVNVLKDTIVDAMLFRPKEGSVLLVTIALAVQATRNLAHAFQAFIARGLLDCSIQSSIDAKRIVSLKKKWIFL